jgi:NAD(P)-dependent dehydrogenase (short-subunit alcohol dehydrogenase family)
VIRADFDLIEGLQRYQGVDLSRDPDPVAASRPHPADAPGSVEETTVEDRNRVLDVNLRAPFLLSRSVFPQMRRAGGGSIINVSSVAGLRGWANAAACCSSKFALTGFTQSLAAEGRPHGIRACVLHPGAMATSWGVWNPEERHRRTASARINPKTRRYPPTRSPSSSRGSWPHPEVWSSTRSP